MSKRKTHEEYENELFEREIDYWPLEQYITNKTPINHECVKGHIWKAKPNSILTGMGCPKCASNRKKTTEEYKLEIANTEYDVLENYLGNKIPILHKHICGYEWRTRPNDILSGYGCPSCSNNKKKNTDEYKTLLPKDITALEEYINAVTPILHKHICGHVWKARPASILNSGTSCPKCSINTLDFDSPATLYLISFNYLGETYYKIGITSKDNVKDRYRGEWNKLNMKLISKKLYQTGRDAHHEEQNILAKYHEYRINTGLLYRGNTETFSCYLPIKNGF